MSRVERWASVARRAGELLVEEGVDAFLSRARKRLSSDERGIFARYAAWAARHDRERPPASRRRLVSVVTPVKDPPLDVLGKTAASVLSQRGVALEWCVADDASASGAVRDELRRIAARDARVRLVCLDAPRGI